MHVTLINPPFTFSSPREFTFSQCIGICHIAAYLEKKGGHSATIIDACFEGSHLSTSNDDSIITVGLTNKEIVDRIPKEAELIGLSVPFSHLAFLSHSLSGEIKRAFPHVPLVMGGVYPSTQPELAIQSEADYLVLGEGEIVLLELINYLNNPDLNPLPQGVVSKNTPESLKNVVPTYVQNVDSLPLPARHLLPFKEYAINSQRGRKDRLTATLLTSRGCPFDCEFCSVHPVCGYKWRPRSPKQVLEEIDFLIDTYGISHFEIEDDNFTFNRKRAMEILEGIAERNNNKAHRMISWAAPNGLRIDTLDEKMMRTISRSNCWTMNLGLEHGDKEVLKIMNKKLSLSKVTEVVKLVHKYRIPCHIFVLYGYPGETRKRFKNAVSFYLQLKKIAPKIDFKFFVTQPYPGTRLFKRCLEQGYIKRGVFRNMNKQAIRFCTSGRYWITTPDFDLEELERRKRVLLITLQRKSYLRYRLRSMIPERLIPCIRPLYCHFRSVITQKE